MTESHHARPAGRLALLLMLAFHHPIAPPVLAAGPLNPRSLASADFNEDGVADLISGYEDADRGLVELRLGDPDAIYPNEPGARRRRLQDGLDPAGVRPFRSATSRFELPEPPDFLGAGDFDNDGHADLLTAALGGDSLYLLRGDGKGGFGEPETLHLPGAVTALLTGELNLRDGLVDVVVALDRPDGVSDLEVLEGPEGAWRAKPESFRMPGPIASLALGNLDDDPYADLIAASGEKLTVIFGRDRKLSLGEAARATVAPASLREHRLGFTPVRVTPGDFGPGGSPGLALVAEDGALYLAGAGDLDHPRPSPGAERDERLVVARGGLGGVAGQARPVATLPMRLSPDARESMVVLRDGDPVPLVSQPSTLSTFVVTNTLNGGPGSLRDAIIQANGLPGSDAITFNIPAPGPYVISPPTPLPPIADPVSLDATTQPGYSGTPIVELDGSLMIPGDGLVIRSGFSLIRGLVVHSFTGNGIVIDGSGHNVIEGNFIGTDPPGGGAMPNTDTGVLIRNSHLNTIGGTAAAARNLISGNGQRGVAILGPSAATRDYFTSGPGITICDLCTVSLPITVFDEERITDLNVTVRLVHTYDGDLRLSLIAPDGTRVLLSGNRGGSGDNYDGTGFDDEAVTPIGLGSAPFFGSYIPDEPLSTFDGKVTTGTWTLEVADTAAGDVGTLLGWSLNSRIERTFGNVVEGNLIGTDITGVIGVGNNKGVVIEESPANLVGGTAPGARNVISGSLESASGDGVEITGAGATSNVVQGNYIGTDITGTQSLPNMGVGILMTSASQCFIGGTAAGAGNLVSGNGQGGIKLVSNSDRNRIQGNYVGTTVSGTVALGNGAGFSIGIDIVNSSLDLVGGDTPGARNLVSGNNQGIVTEGAGCCHVLMGNYVGTDPSGSLPVPNNGNGILIASDGVQVGGAAPGEGNLISGNKGMPGTGLLIGDGADDGIAAGNIIGLDRTATAKLGNSVGVLIQAGSARNLLGGTAPGSANVISGNDTDGVEVFDLGNMAGYLISSSDTPKAIPDLSTITSSIAVMPDELLEVLTIRVDLQHTFDSDLILTLIAPDGTRIILADRRGGSGDDFTGTRFADASTPIGQGSPPFTGFFAPEEPILALSGIHTAGTWKLEVADVASGDFGTLLGWQLNLHTRLPGDNRILGNLVGTNAAGAAGLGNGANGIYVVSGSVHIGGPLPGERNILSGNTLAGVRLVGGAVAGSKVQGNFIGLAPDGISALGNGDAGVLSIGNVGWVGGPAPAYGNYIANNGGAGVSIPTCTFCGIRGTTIRANSIHDNGGLGIDLDPAGVSPNDPGDGDYGGNSLQNFPEVTGLVPQAGGTLILGTLSSIASGKFTIDVYANAQSDPSGYGEGQEWLGSTQVVTSGAGGASWSLFTPQQSLSYVTATATDFLGNTSEFSGFAITVQEASPAKDMRVQRLGALLRVDYTPACGANDHVIYWGIAGPGSLAPAGLNWIGAACGLGVSGVAFFDPGPLDPGRLFYFIIAGQNASVEGSYGQDSLAVERPQATLPVVCDKPQVLGGNCF